MPTSGYLIMPNYLHIWHILTKDSKQSLSLFDLPRIFFCDYSPPMSSLFFMMFFCFDCLNTSYSMKLSFFFCEVLDGFQSPLYFRKVEIVFCTCSITNLEICISMGLIVSFLVYLCMYYFFNHSELLFANNSQIWTFNC